MKHRTGLGLDSSFRSLPVAAGIVAILLGCLALVGWMLRNPALKSLLPGLVPMMPNTALSFALAGGSLCLLATGGPDRRRRRIAGAASCTVVAIASATLGEYLFEWDLGIDQVLFRDDTDLLHPGRMAPNTVLSLLLFGAALLLQSMHRGLAAAQSLSLGAALVSLLAVVGYAYDVREFHGIRPFTHMALNTALVSTVLFGGIVVMHRDLGPMAAFAGEGIGSRLARRLLPGIVVTPLVMGWLVLAGLRVGTYDAALALAILAVACLVLPAYLVFAASRSLNRVDSERRLAEKELAALNRHLEQRIADRTAELEAANRGLQTEMAERSRTHEALQSARLLLEMTFAALDDAVFVVAQATRTIITCNPAAERVFGYSQAEMAGRNPELLYPDRASYEEFQRKLDAAIEGTSVYRTEYLVSRKDGSVFPAEITVSLIRDEFGQRSGGVTVVRDITERRRTEEALDASERRFRSFVEQSAEGMALVDERGVFVVWNRAMEELTGKGSEEALGRFHWDVQADLMVPEERSPEILALTREGSLEALRTGHARFLNHRIQAEFLRPNGSRRVIWQTAFPIETTAGFQIGAVFWDVTEHQRAEEEVRRQRTIAQVLVRTAARLNAGLDLGGVLQVVCEEAARAMKATVATVHLFDAARDEFRLAAAWGLPPQMRRHARPVSRSLWNTLRQETAILVVEDVPGTPSLSAFPALAALGVQKMAVSALQCEGEPVGLLIGATTEQGHDFSQEHMALLEGLAGQAAQAITNARLHQDVHAARDQLRGLSRRLVEAQEAERRHIARELHDEIGQVLTALKLSLDLDRPPSAPPAGGVAQARALADDLLARVRDMSLDLRPAVLDDLGLLPGLLWYIDRYTAQTRVQVGFEHAGISGRRFPPEMETAVYRIAQEALTNVARHAGVAEALVRCWATAAVLGIQIEDEGVGFDAESAPAGRALGGLAGMLERTSLLGGHLVVESKPGRGTRLTADLPLERPGGREADRP